MPPKKEQSKRAKSYIDDMYGELDKVKAWHAKMVAFFATRKAPHIDKILETKKQLENGEAATNEAILFIGRLQEAYKFLYNSSINVTVFKEKIHKHPNKLPSVPHEAGHDESVLTLAGLSHYWYDQGEKHQLFLKRLETAQIELKAIMKRYSGESPRKIAKLEDLLKESKILHEQATKQLEIYNESAHSYVKVQSDVDEIVRNRPKRDVWEERGKYVNLTLQIWRKHDEFCKESQLVTNEIAESEKVRIKDLHVLLLGIGEGLQLSTQTAQEQMTLCLEKIKQTPQQALEYGQQNQPQKGGKGKDKNALHVQTTLSPTSNKKPITDTTTASEGDAKPKEEVHAPPPGPFPLDESVVHFVPAIRRGFFSTKTFTLVFTKTHFIYLLPLSVYSGNDVVKTNPNRDALGSESHDNHVHSYDLERMRWKLDVFKTIATRTGHTLTLFEKNEGFFSRNQQHSIDLPDEATAQEWVELINDHSLIAHPNEAHEPVLVEPPTPEAQPKEPEQEPEQEPEPQQEDEQEPPSSSPPQDNNDDEQPSETPQNDD